MAWLVLAIALQAARLSLPAATVAAAIFVLLPVHGESVAWITGRVDSMPALFYMLAFWAFARWRDTGSRSRACYALSLAMLFVALFTKQTTITMVATLAAWDLVVLGWPAALWPRLRAYLPFVLLTAAYLALRLVLFGQVVRESTLNAEGARYFGQLFQHHLANVIVGRVPASLAAWAAVIACAAAAVMLLRRLPPESGRRAWRCSSSSGRSGGSSGSRPRRSPVTNPPATCTWRPRAGHSSSGILADLAWLRARTPGRQRLVGALALAVCAFYAVRLHAVVGEWNRMAAVSHQAVLDVRREVLASPRGTLLIAGAPTRSWEWAVPFSVRPPYTRTDLTERAFIITPWLLHCCRGQWLDDTQRILREWHAPPRPDRGPALGTGHRPAFEGDRTRVSCLEDGNRGAPPAEQPRGAGRQHPAHGGGVAGARAAGSRLRRGASIGGRSWKLQGFGP